MSSAAVYEDYAEIQQAAQQAEEWSPPNDPEDLAKITREAEARAGMSHRTPGESLIVRGAMYLQDHPRQVVTASHMAAGTGLTRDQCANILGTLSNDRTDVDRVERGKYMYTPGQGRGIKRPVETPGRVTARKAIARGQANQEARHKPATAAFREVPYRTEDGRKVVADAAGVLYSITPLS